MSSRCFITHEKKKSFYANVLPCHEVSETQRDSFMFGNMIFDIWQSFTI
uniref:Uncharacterized protein n=1 Tax=Arundo donax TaxID=35708 RepID=A0A0A9CZA4_ARUDO